MATKKPMRRGSAPTTAPKKTLMENQDTKRKGDSTGKDKVMMTFWVTPERRAEIKAYAADHDMTVSRLIVEGINLRMKEE